MEILDKRIRVDYIKSEIVSLSLARNKALDIVAGKYLGFPDDDCWFKPDFFSSILKIFHKHDEVGAACFRVMDPNLNMSYGRRPPKIVTEINYVNIFRYPTSAGIYIRTSVLKSYDIKFNIYFGVGALYGANEDTEFVHQLLKNKIIVKYFGDISIYHPVNLKYIESDISKSYNYGIGTGVLIKYLLKNGVYSHIFILFKIFIRSIIGYIIFITWNSINAKVLINRVKGVIKGLQINVKDIR